MDFIQTNLIDPVSHILWTYVLVFVLIGAGLLFTWRTRAVQVRLFPAMLRTIAGSRGQTEGISSFQAFAIGLSSRVGTGNITGVAIALTLGGPGAVFWMWVVAALGMATAFVEATLAQVFKVRGPDGTYIGGPATYIERGLGSRRWGIVFAVLLVFTFGVAFSMVQANTIADALASHTALTERMVAVLLVALLTPVLFGGIKRVGRVAEVVMPALAGLYILLALVIVVMNIGALPDVLGQIVSSAFGLNPALAGTGGGIVAAMLNGTKRGLFSNEAGMGSAPNTAATADTPHPANQGLIQSLGVFVDTMMVCSATAFIILVSGVYDAGGTSSVAGAALTREAVMSQLGGWSGSLMTFLIFTFAFTSVMGNYAYVEVNIDYLRGGKRALTIMRIVVLAAVALGSVIALEAVWALADVSMGLMALVNITALVLLRRWSLGALRDWEEQRAAGATPVFYRDCQAMPAALDGDAWPSRKVKARRRR
ncbi:MAG: alanine/glycine:cation symporter family protein [Candidatus Nanopelagicales bacterium]